MASNCSNNLLIAPAVVSFYRNSQIVRASGTRSSNPSPRNRIKLIAQIAQPLQPIIDIEKPWLPPHAFAPNPSNPMESEMLPID